MRLLPGLAAPSSRARASSSTATTRSAAGRSTGSPSRCAQMGARIEAREGRFPPFTVHGAPLTGHRLRAAGRERPGQVVRAAGRARRPTRRRWSSPSRRRDHTERMLAARRRTGRARARRSGGGFRTTVGNTDELELDGVDVPGDQSSAAFLIAAGVLVRGLAAACSSDVGRQLDPRRASCGSSSGWARSCSPTSSRRARSSRTSRSADIDVAERADRGDDGRGRGGAAGDRRAAAGGAARLLRRGRDGRARRRRAAGQGVGPDRDRRRRPARARRRDRGAARRVRRDRDAAGCAAGGSTPTATTGWRCSARSPGLASEEGVEVVGMEAAERVLPAGSRTTSRG